MARRIFLRGEVLNVRPMDSGNLSFLDRMLIFLCTTLLHMLRVFSDHVIYPVVSALRGGRAESQPRVEDRILLMSATDLADKIRSGELSSHQVVTAFIRRLREINPSLNALTDERYRAALEEAKKIDSELDQNRLDDDELNRIRLEKPLLGVPITTKNALAVKGLGNEAGLCLKKGMTAPEDSHVIATMRASGAIPIAVTNTPEMCLWLESYNNLFGKTSNPYDTRRTSGGSSGGEGAILASCGSPLGIGTDIAGSIRVPAAYNGIFGLKPTRNVIDMTGHYPLPKDILYPLLTAGPMCKYAKDLRPVLKLLVGPSHSKKMRLDSAPCLDELKVFLLEDHQSPIITPVRRETSKRTRLAARHLASLSNTAPETIVLPKIAHSFEMYLTYLAKAKCPSLAEELMLLKGKISVTRETVKFMLGKSKHTFPTILLACLEKIAESSRDSAIFDYFYEMSLSLEAEIESILEDNTVLVCPTLPDVAPHHGLTSLRPSILGHTGIWNILGFPAVSIPMGLSTKGMPIGITVVAGKFNDNLCCEVALEMEKAFGGWVPPFETSID